MYWSGPNWTKKELNILGYVLILHQSSVKYMANICVLRTESRCGCLSKACLKLNYYETKEISIDTVNS